MSKNDKSVKRTPLYDSHVSAGARMIEFAGWTMPVQYTGIKDEHLAVRSRAGLFDISHMGEIEVSGKSALEFLQHLTPNDASHVDVGAAQYTAFLNERGGVIDDLIFYRIDADRYLLCVNAANTGKDFAWVQKHASRFDVKVTDVSARTALLALQGPEAEKILASLTDIDPAGIKRFHFAEDKVAGTQAMISRTGYTGEDGFELFFSAGEAVNVWDVILREGKRFGLMPAGLGARDTLRLEMGYSLHGHELDEHHTPYESALGWICKTDKGDFIGRDVLLRQKAEGAGKKLTGLTMLDKSVPRNGYEVAEDESGKNVVGTVTSGTMSPSMGVGIALARLDASKAAEGGEVAVIIRNKGHKASILRPPFYKKS